MPTDRRRTARAVATILLLSAGVFLALPLQHGHIEQDAAAPGTSDSLAKPQIRLRYGRRQLYLAATTATPEHEDALLVLLEERFDAVDVETDFEPGLLFPDNWTAQTARLVELAAATVSVDARFDGNMLSIRGVSRNADQYRERLALLRNTLAANSRIDADVIFVDARLTLAELCQRNFAGIAGDVIEFRQSSTIIRQSSFAFLDKLTEFAYECPGHSIALIGHSDSLGPESWNLRLSRARAQAVADHLASRGVPADRLIVEGRGSEQPLNANDSPQARARNRRVEIELR